jgi:hypothetical protein
VLPCTISVERPGSQAPSTAGAVTATPPSIIERLPAAGGPRPLYFDASPEDAILNKLAWYELGNRVSDQQWRDAQGILRVQPGALDLAYMRRWAGDLGIGELLEAALRGERPTPTPPDDPRQQRMF